jgi:multiple sugar transport system permease protein
MENSSVDTPNFIIDPKPRAYGSKTHKPSIRRFNIFFGNVITYLILIIASIFVIFPMIWILTISLKDPMLTLQYPPVWFFSPTFDHYIALFVQYPFLKYFTNSTVVAIISTIIALIICFPGSYSIARHNTGGRKLTAFILLNRTLPPIAIIIPLFLILRTIRLFDTYFALIIANLTFTLPFTIWTLIGYFQAIPTEIEDAALVDGCSYPQLLRFIVIPMAAPGIIATGIIAFVFCWNEFIYALMLSGEKTRTLPIGVANFLTQYGVRYGELSAATILLVIPAIILTLAVRRYLVYGLSLGGINGGG